LEKPADLRLLKTAAKALLGTHDFSEFGRAEKPGDKTTRTVTRAVWCQPNAIEMEFEVTADAFLYHMVRRMVFLMVLVGQERIDLQNFIAAVNSQKKLNPGVAPARGLCLVKVYYNQPFRKVVRQGE